MKTAQSLAVTLVVSVTVVFPQPSQPFTPDSLTRALWHFNESAGLLVTDTAFGNDGSAVGTTIVPGRFGYARWFNGVGDAVFVPSSKTLDLDTSSFTIDLWLKTTTTATHGIIIRRGLAPLPGFLIGLHYGRVIGQIGANVDVGSPDPLVTIVSDFPSNDGLWHLVTFVRDRPARKLRLYVDGTAATVPVDDPLTVPLTNDRPLTFGRWENDTHPDYFDGSIDEVRITTSNIARPAVEINVRPAAVDFGWTRVGKSDTVEIKITNTGYRDSLSITDITSSNPHFTVSTKTLVLRAGEERTVSICYMPTETQRDTGVLSIASNDPIAPSVRISLAARGYLLGNAPIISKIGLVPYNYGQVRIFWFRSTNDTIGASDPVDTYSLWRRVPGGDAAGVLPATLPLLPASALTDSVWEFLETVPALMFDEYAAIVPRFYDYAGADQWNVYMVAAHTRNLKSYPSKPDSIRWVSSVTAVKSPEKGLYPDEVLLHQNYPNPFNPSTTIKYDLPHSSMVTLRVIDILGREVAVLVNEIKNAGSYEIKFDAAGLSSGVYFYRLQAGEYVETRKLLLLR